MASAPNLLNDDETASMATMFMMSHHGLRRDLQRFERALARADARQRAVALREEWQSYRNTLHGHHHVEDTAMFPSMRAQSPELAACLDGLAADHLAIEPLLTRGDAAFAELSDPTVAGALVQELRALLDAHLAVEEATIVPIIRGATAFPPVESDAEADMFAQGFAWSSHGVASDICDKVYTLLPERLRARLPAALVAFAARCERVWGSSVAGAARTPIPDPLGP